MKINILLPFPSYFQPIPLQFSLLTALDSSYSGGSPHGSSSIWYICTLFHDLLTSNNICWISNSNCTCLVSSILEMQIVISWRFLQFTSFLDKVPQGISILLSLCLPLFLSMCLPLFPPLPKLPHPQAHLHLLSDSFLLFSLLKPILYPFLVLKFE